MDRNKLTKDITAVKLAREVLIEELYSKFDKDEEGLRVVIDYIDDLIDVTEMEVRIQKNKEVT